eukprot:m51a1_g5697 hypothetical protein (174) ;mRNA; r:1020891-1021500
MYFRGGSWDPVTIILQIVCLQSVFYVSLGSVAVSVDIVATTFGWPTPPRPASRGAPTVLEILFDPRSCTFYYVSGWLCILSYHIAAILCSFAAVFVVEKARKCLDFAATVFILHGAACVLYAGPRSLSSGAWWIAQVASLVALALLSEHLCRRRELREIPRGFSSPQVKQVDV